MIPGHMRVNPYKELRGLGWATLADKAWY